MSKPNQSTDDAQFEADSADPPIGWDGQTLQEMLDESERLLNETGQYQALDTLELKSENPFEYERLFSRLRGALVGARETALNVSASPIVREIGELCFQVYTPEGDCVAVSTGIIVHVHTGSLAIKHMIREDYEHDRGIQPGDIFCNNDNDLGNVHTTDVHTMSPIFYDGELVAWADGVTHEIDIGGMTPGHDQLASTSRYDDGLYATCEKVGENDEFYQDWKERGKRGTRASVYWDLDEKCRLAGNQMLREIIHDIIDDVGIETFKQFMYEAVEEGQRTMNERVKERLFPGIYRETSFMPIAFADKDPPKSELQQDMMNHLPVELEVDANGGFSLDMEGASPPGPHPFNCAEGSMEGGMWVALTQCLLHDGKVNDGSYFAVDTNYPEGSIVNPQDPSLSYHTPWGTIMPTYQGVWKNISRGFFARGFREEVVTGYSETSDAVQGGGTLMESFAELIPENVGDYFPVGPFELSCQGLGASAVTDGLDYGYAMWNPESDLGDVEEWEEIQWGLLNLSRKIKPDTAGFGKYRGGSGWEGVYTVMGSEDVTLYNLSLPTVAWSTSGMAGGYPGATKYSVRAHDTDLGLRTVQEDEYPIGDSPPGEFEEHIEGDVTREHSANVFPEQFDNYDLLHYKMGGGPGWGDPLKRSIEQLKTDVEDEIYTPETAESVYGLVGELDEDEREFTVDEEGTEQRRSEIREQRRDESVPYDEFWEEEQQRVQTSDFNDGIQWMYDGVFEQSEEWAEFFRDFWELSDNYTP
jgi:N-methylhydantoinase B/oxoprolinase/acetone carboxylase alpha subunit